MTDYLLKGHGRLLWEEVVAVLAEATCAWADLDGFHIDEAPDEPPATTMLWAWTSDRWYRVYVDGETAIVGQLISGSGEGDGRSVEVTEREGINWGNYSGVSPRPADDRDLRNVTTRLYEVLEPSRCYFVEVEDDDG